MGDCIAYIGLDVHKCGIAVAVAEGGLRGEVREYGRIANTPAALRRLARKLGQKGVGLRFCYEAGPCGYGIQRHCQLKRPWYACGVGGAAARVGEPLCAPIMLPAQAERGRKKPLWLR